MKLIKNWQAWVQIPSPNQVPMRVLSSPKTDPTKKVKICTWWTTSCSSSCYPPGASREVILSHLYSLCFLVRGLLSCLNVGGGPQHLSDSPVAKFPIRFLGFGAWTGNWTCPQACQFLISKSFSFGTDPHISWAQLHSKFLILRLVPNNCKSIFDLISYFPGLQCSLFWLLVREVVFYFC